MQKVSFSKIMCDKGLVFIRMLQQKIKVHQQPVFESMPKNVSTVTTNNHFLNVKHLTDLLNF